MCGSVRSVRSWNFIHYLRTFFSYPGILRYKLFKPARTTWSFLMSTRRRQGVPMACRVCITVPIPITFFPWITLGGGESNQFPRRSLGGVDSNRASVEKNDDCRHHEQQQGSLTTVNFGRGSREEISLREVLMQVGHGNLGYNYLQLLALSSDFCTLVFPLAFVCWVC